MNADPDATAKADSQSTTPAGESLHTTLLKMRPGTGVWGTDGELGPILAIVVDPSTRTATELAVRNRDVAGTGRVIPLGRVVSATARRVDVDLSGSEFFALDRFLLPNRVPSGNQNDPPPDVPASTDVWLMRPGTFLLSVHENVPTDQIPIHRGMSVVSSDGHHAGTVEGWDFSADTGHLVSLDFELHHFLQRRHLLVDASAVDSIDAERVRLTLPWADLEALPRVER